MWRVRFLLMIGMMTIFTPWCYAGAPHQIAGFVLGSPVDQYRGRLDMATVLPVRHQEYLSEVEAKDIPGFKIGYLVFGTCREPHRISKIRLKYANPERSFFDKLLERVRGRFGKPTEYRGDAFQSFIAWKWSFQDRDGNRISMILQHYNRDDEEYTSGNSVKLTMWSLVDEERACHEKKAGSQTASKNSPASEKVKVDFDFLVPK